ncbi:hypothetical protein Rt10032_c14g5382 [Rhodotorula toruloides]|uniref:Uncharacterized protein n=1 Tax=Rhodotorula toruloides TaxID=5286 RepID=A0A511KN82_RHOTO|nr:hypothetical protein Rt10032_c14g5382 [Rhodotorula toruloides]
MQRLPSSAWSSSTPDSSPSSHRQTQSNSPVEEIVYPLTRPTSKTSLAQDRLVPTLPQVLLNQHALCSSASFTTAVSSSDPPQLASRTPNPANSPSAYSPSNGSDDIAFHPDSSRPSLPHPPPLSPLPDSLSALFAEQQLDHPASMPTFFRRRSNSVSDVPSSATRSNSFFGPFTRSRSRKVTSNPSASASTSDLPIISSPLFPQPPPRPLPLSNSPDPFRYSPPTRSPLERGMSVAIGPKAGARLLASQEAQWAMRKADEVIVTADGEEFSIRETVPWRGDGGMSTVTGARTEADAANGEGGDCDQANSSSGARSKSSSRTNHSIKRVPVPPLDPSDSRVTEEPHRVKSIHDLTRHASQEDELTKEDEEARRRRKASLSKASGAGLGSPFAQSPTDPSKRPHRRPPVAGLNSKAEPSSGSNGGRSRRASTDSTASISKDEVLGQLADAIKKERKRTEGYKRECEQGEGELAEIDKNLGVLKEKFATTLEQQEQIIANLRAELDEVHRELDLANELEEEAAREYLGLLSSATAETVKHRAPVVTAFDPSALTSSTSVAPSAGPLEVNTDRSKFSALAFRRGLSLKRRVDTHLAAYGTVASNVAIPKPPLPTSPRLTAVAGSPPSAGSTIAAAEGGVSKHPRKLSKSRTLPPVQQSPAKPHDTPRRDRSSEAPTPTTIRRAPPPPAPIFGNLVSGPSGSYGGPDSPTLFPSHAPEDGKLSPDEVRARNVQEWLRGDQA